MFALSSILKVVGILRYVCVSFSNEEELAAYGFLNHLILDCHQVSAHDDTWCMVTSVRMKIVEIVPLGVCVVVENKLLT